MAEEPLPHGERVFVPLALLDEVLAQLNKELPGPGGYGWNHDGQRAWVSAPVGVDVHAIVNRALNERPANLGRLLEVATALARGLNHTWVGTDHLFLAMLNPDCPGLGPVVLRSFGLTLDDVTGAYVNSMGDPYDPQDRELALPPATHKLLSQATAWARQLQSEDPSSEHALLALLDRDFHRLLHMLDQRGLTTEHLRERTLAAIEGTDLDACEGPVELGPWVFPAPPANLDLALSPAGHRPFHRRNWGSVIFQDGEGRTFSYGRKWVCQYHIDRDGYPVLTTDGQPIHAVVDEAGDRVLDAEGKPMLGPVEIPPGCHVRRRPK